MNCLSNLKRFLLAFRKHLDERCFSGHVQERIIRKSSFNSRHVRRVNLLSTEPLKTFESSVLDFVNWLYENKAGKLFSSVPVRDVKWPTADRAEHPIEAHPDPIQIYCSGHAKWIFPHDRIVW